MEKADQELVVAYHKIEEEVKEQEGSMEKLSKKLCLAQKGKDKATANLEREERAASDNKLTTVKDVEDTRKKVQYSKYAIEDYCQVITNIELAIRNSQNTIQDLIKRKDKVSKQIWDDYASTLSAKIYSLVKDDVDRLWVALRASNPNATPLNQYELADAFSFMLEPGADKMNALRREILNEILNGTSNSNNVK